MIPPQEPAPRPPLIDPRYSTGLLVFSVLLVAFALFRWSRGVPEPRIGPVDIRARRCDTFLVPEWPVRLRIGLAVHDPRTLLLRSAEISDTYDFTSRKVRTGAGDGSQPAAGALAPLREVQVFRPFQEGGLAIRFDGTYRELPLGGWAGAAPPGYPARREKDRITLFSGTLTVALRDQVLLRQAVRNLNDAAPPCRLLTRPEDGLIVYATLESTDPLLSRVVVIQADPFGPLPQGLAPGIQDPP